MSGGPWDLLTFGLVFFVVGLRRSTGRGSRLVVSRRGGGRGRRRLAVARRWTPLAGPADHVFRWRYNNDDDVLSSLHLNRRWPYTRSRRGISWRTRAHRRRWNDRSVGRTWRRPSSVHRVKYTFTYRRRCTIFGICGLCPFDMPTNNNILLRLFARRVAP